MADIGYIGNQDFRGYLNYLSQNGYPEYGDALSNVLNPYGYIDNQGNINRSVLNEMNQASASGGGETDAQIQQRVVDQLTNAYQTYQGYQNPPSAPRGDQPDIPGYNLQIGNVQSTLGRLGTQQTSGNTGIENAYQSALQQLLLGRNQAEGAYGTAVQGAKTDYVGAKNTIGAQAGAALNSLRRLLGSRGAGGSSAYNISAPQAVGRGATLQRADAGNLFAGNRRDQDTNWGNYMTAYGNELTGAAGQRDEQKRTLEQSIGQERGSLLQELARLQFERAGGGGAGAAAAQPYLNQANSLLDRLANSAPARINYNTQAYQAPSLASYNTTPQSTTYARSGNDYFSPFLSALLGKKQPRIA